MHQWIVFCGCCCWWAKGKWSGVKERSTVSLHGPSSVHTMYVRMYDCAQHQQKQKQWHDTNDHREMPFITHRPIILCIPSQLPLRYLSIKIKWRRWFSSPHLGWDDEMLIIINDKEVDANLNIAPRWAFKEAPPLWSIDRTQEKDLRIDCGCRILYYNNFNNGDNHHQWSTRVMTMCPWWI